MSADRQTRGRLRGTRPDMLIIDDPVEAEGIDGADFREAVDRCIVRIAAVAGIPLHIFTGAPALNRPADNAALNRPADGGDDGR